MAEKTAQERLVEALKAAKAPAAMIEKAQNGLYDDFKSPLATPKMELVSEARFYGLEGIAKRAVEGEFDSGKAEAEAWAASEEGQRAMRRFGMVNPFGSGG